MNILLTCAGRRNYLVQFFKRALGSRGQVLACDCSDSAPALSEADQQFIVPRVNQPDYFEALLSICREQQVRLLFSMMEFELTPLSQHVSRFREIGTLPVIASPQIVATCLDKWKTFHFLKACDIPTPDTYLTLGDARLALSQGVIKFPLMIKPRWGVSSIGVDYVDNDRELAVVFEWGRMQVRRTILAQMSDADPNNCLIIQERLEGHEYGMDVVNDLSGHHVGTLARRKLVMHAGNTDRAITVAEPRLDRIGKAIGERLKHPGSLDCDVMVTDKGCFVLDLNPRFGGGYVFSHLAGANLPAALIAWANREQPDPSWLKSRPGVVVSKYDGVVVIDEAVTPDKHNKSMSRGPLANERLGRADTRSSEPRSIL